MRPFFARIGNKYPIRNEIIKRIPEHTIYVEPFVGSGAILFSKEPSQIEIINDLDKTVFENFNMLKEANPDISAYTLHSGKENIQKFVDCDHESKENQLLKRMYVSANTFSSVGRGKIFKPDSGKQKIKRIKPCKERLTNVQIFNTDFKEIIEQYDSEETFFFLDPPYENSKQDLYKHHIFDYVEFLNILKKIKGKFLLTMNDSENIQDIFKEFNIDRIIVIGNYLKTIGSKDRKELIITNY